jgi:hypothetical protein
MSLALTLMALASSCTHNAQPVRVSMQPLPPLSGRLRIATTIVPRSQKFKVAVLTFLDQTGRAKLVVDPIADVLTTELFEVKRFELYDRQDLVEQTHVQSHVQQGSGTGTQQQIGTSILTEDKTKTQYAAVTGGSKVDGILLGYITSYKINEAPPPPEPVVEKPRRGGRADAKAALAALAPTPPPAESGSGEFDCDFRIVNTVPVAATDAAPGGGLGLKELVVFSDSAKVRFRMKGDNIELERSDVGKIAEAIKKKFPDFTKQTIKITSLQDRTISLNVGEQDGVKQGFTGYVVEKDDKTGVYRYLAEFVIINVFPSAATAVVVPPSGDASQLPDVLANIRVGSEAVIK